MANIDDIVRDNIRGIIPYDPKQTEYLIKLDANENPYGLPVSVEKRMLKFAKNPDVYRLYPDSNCSSLRKKIAAFWKIGEDEIVVGKGSDELIQLLTEVFVDSGDVIVAPSPSFEMYSAAARVAGGRVIFVNLSKESNFLYDANEFTEAANSSDAKIIYLCNPNNPTGNTIPIDAVEYIAAMCPRSVVAVDEAYAEFGAFTAAALTAKYENIVVLRTFSKAWGLAGLRCGYSIASKSITKYLYAVKPPYNVPTFTQIVASELLDAAGEISERIDTITSERDRLSATLSAEIPGIKVFPSKANFLLVQMPAKIGLTGEETYRALAARGILVRSFRNSPQLVDCVRVTIGTREQNDLFAGELKTVCGGDAGVL